MKININNTYSLNKNWLRMYKRCHTIRKQYMPIYNHTYTSGKELFELYLDFKEYFYTSDEKDYNKFISKIYENPIQKMGFKNNNLYAIFEYSPLLLTLMNHSDYGFSRLINLIFLLLIHFPNYIPTIVYIVSNYNNEEFNRLRKECALLIYWLRLNNKTINIYLVPNEIKSEFFLTPFMIKDKKDKYKIDEIEKKTFIRMKNPDFSNFEGLIYEEVSLCEESYYIDNRDFNEIAPFLIQDLLNRQLLTKRKLRQLTYKGQSYRTFRINGPVLQIIPNEDLPPIDILLKGHYKKGYYYKISKNDKHPDNLEVIGYKIFTGWEEEHREYFFKWYSETLNSTQQSINT